MKIKLILILLACNITLSSQDYFEDRLYIKVKNQFQDELDLTLDKSVNFILAKYDKLRFQKAFKSHEMRSVYEVQFKDKAELSRLISQLEKISYIDYAERIPIYRLFFTPNDPQYSSQWNLAKIQADLAWNLSTGCSGIKVAITDDGFLMTHEDLAPQWYINTGEIMNNNGIDDDANGYIDDWRGWDAANNDNNPSAFNPTNSYFTHGTHVAGIAGAATNNSLGIASIGYNNKLIPVKIGRDVDGALTGAMQGLDYAINASGCDVINMSWGGGGFSMTMQLLFNLAYSKGIICVAAAGNSSANVSLSPTGSPMYPAAYNHVISVASSTNTDAKSGFSNYGSTIDVTAPGSNILSCLAGGISSYGNLSGTSMASPLVAGLCGLMKCYNPMPIDSIEACLKRTCDNINTQNPSYIGQLGAGRINAFQALQCLTQKPISDFYAKDTMQCIGKKVRYFATSFGVPVLNYSWSFPGGSPLTSTLKNPEVTYAANGVYSATLTTINSIGSHTITKTNIVKIGPPEASLIGRKYTSYNSNPVIIVVKFKGNPPFNVTLTDGTNNFTQNNITANPYYFSIVPLKDTSLISISSFQDTQCVGTKLGQDTIYKITLTNGGGTSYCESSFKFDGTSNNVVKIDKFNGANWKDLYSTNGYTWECWFNLGNRSGASVTGVESLVAASDAIFCEDLGLHFNWPWAGGGKLNWVISGQGGCSGSVPRGVISTNMTFNANTWYHAAGVMDYTTNTVLLYVNGQQVASGTITIPLALRMQNNVAVTIGNQDVNYNPYSGGFSPFKGKIDEVRFWNSVRTPAQILANYKTCLPSTTTNLVAYFKGDEGTGTSSVSKINGNFVGTLQNNASWDTQVDSVKNCTICATSLCQDSIEITSAQTGWEAMNTSGTWGSLTSCNYVTSIFTANAANFPGMNIGDCLWGPIVQSPLRTYYNSASQTTTSTSNASVPIIRKQFALPTGAYIDSVRLWMLSDDFVDSVLINSTPVYNAAIPIIYGQVLYTKTVAQVGNGQTVNYVTVKPGDFGGNYGTYFRMKVYYSKSCSTVITDCDTTNLNTGLVLNLPFNGNTQDISGLGNHATNFGATPVAGKAGIPNTAYRFDSTNFMSVAHHATLNLRSFTLTAIVKPLKFNTDVCFTNNIINKGTAATGAQWAMQYAPTTSTTCYNRDTSECNMILCGSVCPSSNSITNTLPYMVHNKWECAVLTYDSVTKDVKMYMNGVLRHQWNATFNSLFSQNTANVFIGKYNDPTYPGYLQGIIDDIRIYNRVLTHSEVKGYCGTCTVVQPPSDCDTTNLNTGLVLNLPFNGNTNDISGNNNHATNYGATAVAGKLGVANTAYKFNGSTNYMKVLNSSTLGLNSAYTVTCKMQIDGFNSAPCRANSIFFKGHSVNVAGNQHFDWVYSPNAYTGSCSAPLDIAHQNLFPSSLTINSPTAHTPYLQPAKWYCFAVVQKNDTLYNYIDGVMVYKTPNTGTGTNPYDIFIGRSDYPSYPYWLNATIDDIRVYNRSLAPSEVKGYCGTCTVVQPPSDCDTTNLNTGLVLNLPFNGNTNDVSGNGNHATNNGAIPVAGKAGIPNTAYSFNGTSSYLQIANSSSLNNISNITMTAILKPKGFYTGTCFGNAIIQKGVPDGVVGNFSLRYSPLNSGGCNSSQDPNQNNFYAFFSTGGCSGSQIYSSPYVKQDSWYCVVSTYNGDSLFTYINGYLRLACKPFIPIGSNTQDLFIGRLNSATFPYWLNAEVDDIRIYNRVLSLSEVKGYCGTCTITSPPIPCDTSGLVLCMAMNGNTQDSTKYNNHGTNNGATLTTDRFGNSNSAYSFNGTNGYIEVPNSNSLQIVNDLTISLWVNQNNTISTGYRLIDKITSATGDGYMFDNYGHPTNTTFRGRTTRFIGKDINWSSNNKPYSLNSWNHIVVTHKNGKVTYYTNGVYDTSYYHTLTTLNINTLPLRIGTNNPSPSFYFSGLMDDIKIYKRELSATEVNNLYTKPFTCSCNSVSQPPKKCDTARKYDYLKCTNDNLPISVGLGTKYQWSPSTGLSKDTIRNPNCNVKSNITYYVLYNDTNGCQLIDTVNVMVKKPVFYSPINDQLICNGDSVQVTIPINASGVIWSPSMGISNVNSTSPYLFPSTTTTYYLQFIDNLGCMQYDTIIVNVKTCCAARARFKVDSLLCFGTNLWITNTSKNSTIYNWSFPNAIPSAFVGANPPMLSFPTGNTYPIRLIVGNGFCFDTLTKNVSIVKIEPYAGRDTSSCLAAFSVDLGESPISDWTYKWTPTSYLNDATISNPVCTIINDSINYILEVTDKGSGCKGYDTVQVKTIQNVITIVDSTNLCQGDSLLFNNIQRKTTGTYFYTIKKVNSICDSIISIKYIKVLVPITINQSPEIHCNFYIDKKGKRQDTSYTRRDTIKYKVLPACDSLRLITPIYIFKPKYDSTTLTACKEVLFNNKKYTVSKRNIDSTIITGPYSGCDSIIRRYHAIVLPIPNAQIVASKPNILNYGDTVVLTASGGFKYLWQPSNSINSTISHLSEDTFYHTYIVRVTDTNQCWDTAMYTVKGRFPDTLYYGIPNIFSPNGDGRNDIFIPNMNYGVRMLDFYIWNRWGEKMWESHSNKGWDGYYKNKPAPASVYVYYVMFQTPWGKREYKGSFTLMR